MYKVQFTKQAGRSSQLSKDSYKKSNYSIWRFSKKSTTHKM